MFSSWPTSRTCAHEPNGIGRVTGGMHRSGDKHMPSYYPIQAFHHHAPQSTKIALGEQHQVQNYDTYTHTTQIAYTNSATGSATASRSTCSVSTLPLLARSGPPKSRAGWTRTAWPPDTLH
ncbi:unnamed protein product [Ectocarpus sp. 12 AP-2014]